MERFPRAKKVIITLRGSINANHNTWADASTPTANSTSRNGTISPYRGPRGRWGLIYGGLIYGLLTYTGDDSKALEFAVAASCLKHTVYGDFNLVPFRKSRT